MQSSEASASEPAPEQSQTARSAGNIGRIIKLGAAIGILLILGLLAAAVATALTAAETWVPIIRIFRDVMLLILLLESVLLIAALAILLLQVAGFFVMLRAEIKPILESARETARLGRATATFMNDNAVDPLIQLKSFLAGLLAFLRELLRIRGLLTTDETNGEALDEADAP